MPVPQKERQTDGKASWNVSLCGLRPTLGRLEAVPESLGPGRAMDLRRSDLRSQCSQDQRQAEGGVRRRGEAQQLGRAKRGKGR